MIHDVLNGLRVLVVEDELLIAMMIEDLLAEQFCVVVGPFSAVADALAVARSEKLDLAVLDVNVHGEKIYPVGELLAARRIPFILLSGYGQGAIPPEHPDWQAVAKPFQAQELPRLLAARVIGG